ncbi:MAG: hypothetical protein HKO13_06355 [Sphingomonas sp.]|nr:hypothetical protein [Sphingomonas sp.]
MKRLLLPAALFGLAACGDAGLPGPQTALNDAQFAELQEECALGDAMLVASNRTENFETEDGVSMSITYENDEPEATTIKLTRVRGDQEIAELIMCTNRAFERMNATATLSLPEGQLGL